MQDQLNSEQTKLFFSHYNWSIAQDDHGPPLHPALEVVNDAPLILRELLVHHQHFTFFHFTIATRWQLGLTVNGIGLEKSIWCWFTLSPHPTKLNSLAYPDRRQIRRTLHT